MTNFKELRRVYGFDEVAIVPGAMTINPDMTDTSFSLGDVDNFTVGYGGSFDCNN